jgi:hypothetical protein
MNMKNSVTHYNPNVTLLHFADPKNADSIEKNGLIPNEGHPSTNLQPTLSDWMDELMPIRKESVYFYVSDTVSDTRKNKVAFSVNASDIPCRCYEINHGTINQLMFALESKTSEFQYEALVELGFDSFYHLSNDTDDKVWKHFWDIVDRKNENIKGKWLQGFYESEEVEKAVEVIQNEITFLSDDREKHQRIKEDGNPVEVLCPCKMPPSIIERTQQR